MNLKTENFNFTHSPTVTIYNYESSRNLYDVYVFSTGAILYCQNGKKVLKNKYHEEIIKHFRLN